MMLAAKSRNGGNCGSRVAQDLARETAREQLKPLFDTACSRLASVLHRSFDIAVESQASSPGSAHHLLRPYVAFNAALRSAYHAFVTSLEEKCKMLLGHQLEAGTSEFATGPWADENEAPEEEPRYIEEAMSFREPLMPISSQMTVPETPSPDMLESKRRTRVKSKNMPITKTMNQFASLTVSESSTDICVEASKTFGRICTSMTSQTVPTIVRTAYLDPASYNVACQLSLDLFACSDKDFMSLFAASGAVMALEAKRDALARRAAGLVKCKNEFQELSRCL